MKEVNTDCCNKPMIDLGVVDFMNMNINTAERFFCGECGRTIDIISYSNDEDTIMTDLDMFEDKLKDTKIYKELMEAENEIRSN